MRTIRYMPFWVATGSLGILFALLIIYLVATRQLIPPVVILGSVILFVLFLTGLIKISIELFGPSGGVNSTCTQYVQNNESKGQSIYTLAWLEQNNICTLLTFGSPRSESFSLGLTEICHLGQCWRAAFSFAIIGAVFLLWMIIMAWQVQNESF